jgi:hypothetical protein
MDIEEQPAAPKHELIGGPFSVLESDPGKSIATFEETYFRFTRSYSL